MAKFDYAEEAKEIGLRYIEQYHQHITDFGIRVDFLFTDKVSKRKGKEVWVQVKKVRSLSAFFANVDEECEPFFVIIIPEPIWDALDQSGKEALIDDGLCHIHAEMVEKGDEQKLKVSEIPPDVEEYSAVIRRHGLWREEALALVQASQEKKQD